MATSKRIAGVGALLAASACLLAWREAKVLYVDGQRTSVEVHTLDGRAYVPLADVAKLMGLRLKERADGFDLTRLDPPSSLRAAQAPPKVEEAPTAGSWQFKLLDLGRSKRYDVQFSVYILDRSIDAPAGSEFVTVKLRGRNLLNEKEELVLGPWEGNDTALVDAEGQTYSPEIYDARETEGSPVGVVFAPKAAVDFVLVFKIPVGTKPKGLLFTAIRYAYKSPEGEARIKPAAFRFELGKEASPGR